jgi:hypothetical protein
MTLAFKQSIHSAILAAKLTIAMSLCLICVMYILTQLILFLAIQLLVIPYRSLRCFIHYILL